MIRGPTRGQIAALHNLTAREYARWLRVGLENYLIEGKGRGSFPGAENYVGRFNAIEQDLALISDALDRDEQAQMRSAVQIVLAELGPEAEQIECLRRRSYASAR